MDANNHEAFNCQIKHLLTEKRVIDVSKRGVRKESDDKVRGR